MHILHRRGWEIPERLATPESVFLNRRAFLGGAVGAAAVALSPDPAAAQRLADLPDPSRDLYPAKHNEVFTLDRADHRRGGQHDLQQFLRVRLVEDHRQGGAGSQAQAMDRQDRRHGGEGAGDRDRRPDPQDTARGAALSPSLRRGLVDGDPVVGLSARQAGGAGEAVVVGQIPADGDIPRSRRPHRVSARPGIPGLMSRD